ILEIPYHKTKLITEFRHLEEAIANLGPKSIMIRDFQARNIMAAKNEIYFIDYQSAMNGPRMYDVISFLYQAKANFPESFRQEMLDYFISLFKDEKEKEQLRTSIMPLRLIRSLQVLGAYGFRGLVQKKSHFRQSIGQGLKNLKTIEKTWTEMNPYPGATGFRSLWFPRFGSEKIVFPTKYRTGFEKSENDRKNMAGNQPLSGIEKIDFQFKFRFYFRKNTPL